MPDVLTCADRLPSSKPPTFLMAAYYIFMNQPDEAVAQAYTTLMFAVAIALGILAGYSLPARLFGWRRNVNPQDGNNPQ